MVLALAMMIAVVAAGPARAETQAQSAPNAAVLSVAGWGFNQWGQLGNDSTYSVSVPDQPVKLNAADVKALAAGAGHSLALKNDSTVLA